MLLRSVWTPMFGMWSTATCWSRPRTRSRRLSSRFTRWCRETRTRATLTRRRTQTCWRVWRSLRPSHRLHPTWRRSGFLLESCPFGPGTGRKWRLLQKPVLNPALSADHLTMGCLPKCLESTRTKKASVTCSKHIYIFLYSRALDIALFYYVQWGNACICEHCICI